MISVEIIAYICASDGGIVACTEGNSINTLRECAICRKNHKQEPCRVNMAGNSLIYSEVDILSIRAQVEDAINRNRR